MQASRVCCAASACTVQLFCLLIFLRRSCQAAIFDHSEIGGSALATLEFSTNRFEPQQIHLQWDGHDGQMTVIWSTPQLESENNTVSNTLVLYGDSSDSLTSHQLGTARAFVDGGAEHNTQYIHTVTLTGLTLNSTYFYRVGSTTTLSSETFKFRSLPASSSPNWQPRLLVFGDMGTRNSRSLIEMTKEAVQQDRFDMILHNGDMAYDMADDGGANGDAFMNNIESLAAYVPYLTTAGNHENQYNFSHYKNRFNHDMPDSEHGMYYSLDIGPIHFIGICTEFYFYVQYGTKQIYNQHRWLEAELQRIRQQQNTSQWIVVAGHRPLYCSNPNPLDCSPWGSIVRDGICALGVPGVEELLYKYGVDLYLGAHEHSYERLWPVYKKNVRNGTTTAQRPYTDPLATTYVVAGTGGNPGGQYKFRPHPFAYSAFRSSDYGFLRVQAHNTTHMHLEQVSIEAGAQVIDEFWLVKSEPTPAWLRSNNEED